MKLSNEETADMLAQLHNSEFNGKTNGRFRIGRMVMAKIAGRENIEQPSVDQIKMVLSENHGLLLIDQHDEFAILKSTIPRRYRKATSRVIEDVLGISFDSDVNDEED